MRNLVRISYGICCVAAFSVSPAAAQTGTGTQGGQVPPVPVFIGPPPPPATQLEGFQPATGSIITLGYDDLGEVAGVAVEVREVRDMTGGHARGVVVTIGGGPQTPHDQSFVDADELPELLRGLDTLLAITANPTPFRSFEVRYATKGELAVTASSAHSGGVIYRVEVGRLQKVRSGSLNGGEAHLLRMLFEAASQRLATLPAEK